LAGILPERRQVTGLPTASLLRLSPLLIAHPKNAERLEIALRDVLRDILGGARVRVEQLTGGYARLDDASRCRLGVDARLGRNTTLGRRVRAPASRVRVALGPLPPAACARLSPGGDGEKKLVAVCELFAPAEIDVEVELLPTAALPARLGGQAPARLGRSWLRSRRRAAPMRFVASSTPRDDAEERLHAR
jgi:predicted component of type VI protein secretion system